MGFKEHQIEVFEEAQQLKGYHGDFRSQRAHVRIKGSGWSGQNYVGGASNDLGWERQSDGTFAFHVSDYDVSKHNKTWQDHLSQYYAAEVIYEIAEERGFSIEEEIEENGEIYIKAYHSAY